MLCAERGHVSMVETLLGAGADVSAVDENGNSPLHLACFYSHREVARLLLSAEDVDVTVSVGFNFLPGRTPGDLTNSLLSSFRHVTLVFARASGYDFERNASCALIETCTDRRLAMLTFAWKAARNCSNVYLK